MKKRSFLTFISKKRKEFLLVVGKSFFWFSVGAILGLCFFLSFVFFFFQRTYSNVVYPGVMVNGIHFGGKTQTEVKTLFAEKNEKIADTKFIFTSSEGVATISAKQLNFGYNENLLAQQAYSLGRSGGLLSSISLVLQAYVSSINLPPSYHYSEDKLQASLLPMMQKINTPPVDALFTFKNGRVSAFRPSADGQEIDIDVLKSELLSKTVSVVSSEKPQTIIISVPVKIVTPKVTTDKANSLGIKELIGKGDSLFQNSIQSRIYNISLAATRLNGILIAPAEVFSFNQALGEIAAFTGYQQAYIIQNGRTVLGDGGGVCQVSTTLFRAALNAGLPIVERHAHAYRVGYYEQDSDPGFDATVYAPSVDLKFRNDTGNYILIQSSVDPAFEQLTFMLYGTKDGRQVVINKSIIISQTPPLPPIYQDDPTIPKGVIKQVDFQASGANVYFTRQVVKNGKVIASDKFVSNYRPWQAVYLKGTKE